MTVCVSLDDQPSAHPRDWRPLLRHVVEASFTTLVSPVIVVLGAHAGKIRPSLLGLPVRVIVNRSNHGVSLTDIAASLGQPVSATVNAVRATVSGGPLAAKVLIAVAWSVGIILVLAPLAVRRYRTA